MNRVRQPNAGFTLMEAMIASAILLFALGSILALASAGFRYVNDMRRWARSSQVLQQKMEDIRLITVWTNLWALNNTTFTDHSVSGMPMSGQIRVTSYNPPYPTNFFARVTITVTWTNSSRSVVTNRLTAAICQNGLNKYIF